MEMNIKQVTIMMPVNIGDISEKKQFNLNNVLIKDEDFDSPIFQGNQIIYTSKERDKNIIVRADRITFDILVKNSEVDIKRVNSILSKVYDALLIDENTQGVIDIKGTINTEDSHLGSKELFNKKFNNSLEKMEEIYGVGYRFLISNEKYNGEIKIEPLIQDKSFYFFQYIMSFEQNVNLDQFVEYISVGSANIKDKFSEYLKEIII